MPLTPGHERQPASPSRALLQGWVTPEVKERARRGAAARGISIAKYLAELVEADPLAGPVTKKPSGEKPRQLPLAV